ncbi:MAG: carbohydrate ABC transporter substrate-binding protein [Clostridia bacterium]|nr:carbohydrate ABC transporter substrate-binding protein [Clostridia bacterium]
MKSKFMLWLLTCVLCAGLLAGCGNNNNENNSGTGGTAGENAKVDIYQFKVEIAKELENAAALYMKNHPNVKINIQTVGGGDDYGASLRAKMQSGEEPTIFNIGGPQDTQDWMQKLEDLSDQPWVSQAVDTVLDSVTADGKIYGLPYAIEGYGFIYNTEIFKAADIDPSTIHNYDTLLAAVRTLDEKIKSGALKSQFPQLEAVFEFPGKETWVSMHTVNVPLSQEFTSATDAFEKKTVSFQNADAFKALIDIQADYSSNANSKGKLNAVDYATQVGQGIAIERVAMIQQGNWIYGDIENVDAETAAKMSLLPMPLVGEEALKMPVGVPMYWCVNKDSNDADKKAAKEFLTWLYTSEEGKEMIVNKFYFIPPLKGYTQEPSDPLSRAVKTYADDNKTRPWVFMGFPTSWGMDSVGVQVQRYLSGEATFTEAVEKAKADWEAARASE